MNEFYLGDCLEVMDRIDDKSVDLIITDPPYNIGKVKSWDKWKTKDLYIDWCGKWLLQCQRVLKDNGSFYFFHNDMVQIAMLIEWIRNNTGFIFKQFIVWNKKFEGSWNQLNAVVENTSLRNYSKQAEYFLFYTFQDETGLTTVKHDTSNFQSLRKYFYDLLCFMGETNTSIAKQSGHRKAEHSFYVLPKKIVIDIVGQKADHCFRYGSAQWDLPTEETYKELISVFNIDRFEQFRSHECLRQEYESLRQEYESLRYTFNNQKTHHSVWNYEVETGQHPTQKPVALIENIIKHSSNEGNTVLDLFAGSGTTGIACINTNRNYILIEKDETYFNLAKDRIEKHLEVGRQGSLF